MKTPKKIKLLARDLFESGRVNEVQLNWGVEDSDRGSVFVDNAEDIDKIYEDIPSYFSPKPDKNKGRIAMVLFKFNTEDKNGDIVDVDHIKDLEYYA